MNEIILSPSELDYKPKKCPRCFYLHKNKKIAAGDFPPPVFSSFDVAQKNYFKSKNCKDLTNELPDGYFMSKNEIPGKIVSEGLNDNKNRKFKLKGIPDIVIKFKEKAYGIIDFKTTSLTMTKSQNYKYQLEAYAQIFTNPGKTKSTITPKLNPITHMGILQFYPNSIEKHRVGECTLKMKTMYSPLIRNEKDFFAHITNIIDLLERPNPPDFTKNCNFCNFVQKQKELENILI